MKYVQASFATTDATLKEILVAHLAEQGFESFNEDNTALHAYIQQDMYDEAQFRELCTEYELVPDTAVIEQQNWNEEWEKGFTPVTVDGFCTIRATFHDPDTTVQHDIIITPKMSFGTGHHATTQLMVQQMRSLDFAGKRVFDFGTGTGVLAILAEKLGAASIVAVDNDEWSYENTLENIGFNDAKSIEVHQGSIELAGTEQFDIILANINRHILLQYMQEMKRLLKDGGTILMSGILTDDETLIVSEAQKAGLKHIATNKQDQWICVSFTS